MNFPILRTGLETILAVVSSLADFFVQRHKQECSQVFSKENFQENICKTHPVCFNQLDFLAAPAKSKQGKWLSFFVVFCNIFLSRLDSTKHILCGKVSRAADEIKFPVIIWGVSQLESQHMWRSSPFNAHKQGKGRKWSPLRRIVKPGVK